MEEASFAAVISKVFGNRAKIIVSVRNMPAQKYGMRAKWMMRILYRRADSIVAVTETLRRYLEQVMQLANVEAIPNPVYPPKAGILPARYENVFTPETFVFIAVGKLIPVKGHANLVRAFREIATHSTRMRLVIIGEGELRPKLDELVGVLELKDRVFLLGDQRNIYPFLRASDCLVHSSLWEGFPNVLVEALSVGLPIIAADCETGPREILVPELPLNHTPSYPHRGSFGILTKPFSPLPADNEEAIVQLAGAMRMVLENPGILTRYAEQGSKRTSAFHPDTILGEWKRVISRVLS